MSRLRYPFTEVSARCRLCGAEGLTASSEHALGGRLIDWRRSHAPVCPEWPRWAEKKGLRLDERGALLYPSETGPYEPRVRPKAEDAEAQAEETTEVDAAPAQAPAPADALERAPARVDPPTIEALGSGEDAGSGRRDDALNAPLGGDPERVLAEPLERAALDVDPPSIEALSVGNEAAVGSDSEGVVAEALERAPAGVDDDAPEELAGEVLETTRGRGLWLVPDAELGLPEIPADEDAETQQPIPLPVAGATRSGGRRRADNSPRSNRGARSDVDLMKVPIERLRQAELF